ncbi:MAG: hypothetical protein R6T99_00405 [Bacteroidales bacterium]
MSTNKEETSPVPGKQKSKTRQYQIVLILLLMVIAGLIIWLFVSRSNLNDLISEKEKQRDFLQVELDSLMVRHEQVKDEYGELADSLSVKDSIITANAAEIRKLLNTQWEYYKVKKKLERLQVVSQNYVRQMDSLYRVNEQLSEENIAIKRDLQDVQREKEEISRDKKELMEKVHTASALQAYKVHAEGIRDRWLGSREKPTDKANRLDKIKVCFTLGKNDIIPSGPKDLYIRIAQPDKEILTKDRSNDYTFMYEGEPIQYSIKKAVDYQNQPIDLCLYWKKMYDGQPILEGTYNVDIFADGNVIGHTTFTLR